MATSVIAALIDALLANMTTAMTNAGLSVNVVDGPGNTDDPGDYLLIGVDNPESFGESHAGDSVQGWAHANHTDRDEEGDITCGALSWNGDADQKAARDAVFAITAVVENELRSNYGQGVDGLLWTGYGSSTQLVQNQNDAGAMALLIFRIHFRARI